MQPKDLRSLIRLSSLAGSLSCTAIATRMGRISFWLATAINSSTCCRYLLNGVASTASPPEQAAAIESNTNEIRDLKTMLDAFSVQLAQLNTQIGDLQGAVARRDANY